MSELDSLATVAKLKKFDAAVRRLQRHVWWMHRGVWWMVR